MAKIKRKGINMTHLISKEEMFNIYSGGGRKSRSPKYSITDGSKSKTKIESLNHEIETANNGNKV